MSPVKDLIKITKIMRNVKKKKIDRQSYKKEDRQKM